MSYDKPCCWDCKYCKYTSKHILFWDKYYYICTNYDVLEAHGAHDSYSSSRHVEVVISDKALSNSACNYFSPKTTLKDVGFHKT